MNSQSSRRHESHNSRCPHLNHVVPKGLNRRSWTVSGTPQTEPLFRELVLGPSHRQAVLVIRKNKRSNVRRCNRAPIEISLAFISVDIADEGNLAFRLYALDVHP